MDLPHINTMTLIPSHDPILRRKANTVDLQKLSELGSTIQDMKTLMRAKDAVGLAAPQIGLDLTMFVMDYGGTDRVCINPAVLEASEETEIGTEGCLSFPGLRLEVVRPFWITAFWFDENGEPHTEKLRGWEARIFLHEWDHCHGILFTDRVGKVTLRMAKAKAEKRAKEIERNRRSR